jgi:hypothetical protein
MEGTSPHGRARDPDTRYDQRTGMPKQLSIHSPRFGSRRDDQVASNRPSFGRRVFRTMTRFFIAVLIGVGATLAWQSYGDAAREMVAERVPTLAWLSPVSAANSPVVSAVSPDLIQQLEPLVSNLDIVRRSVERLAAKQDEIARDVATLQAVQEDIRQKLSSTPPAPAQQGVLNPQPQPRPPQPRTQPLPVRRAPPPAGPPSN